MAINENNCDIKSQRRTVAAELVLDDYLKDPELTAFAILDGEDFQELNGKTYSPKPGHEQTKGF